MRSSKEADFFPYSSKRVCYIEVTKSGEVRQISCSKECINEVYTQVKQEQSVLYAVWPGQWRSDLFIIDDIDALADAYGIDRGN